MDLFRILLLGIIIYKFGKITFKPRIIEGLPPTSLNWSTIDNPKGKSMINNGGLNILDQGFCGTCVPYSIASLLSCHYNIHMSSSGGGLISITPQSIIDIILRYNDPPIYHNYNEIPIDKFMTSIITGTAWSCNINIPDLPDFPPTLDCGYRTSGSSTASSQKKLLDYLHCLKNPDTCTSELGRTIPRTTGTKYNFPLLKSNPTREDAVIFQTITNTCIKRVLFNEDLITIQNTNYMYTEHFTPDSFVDFNFNLTSPFAIYTGWESVDIANFKRIIKENLEGGPLAIEIHTNEESSYDSQGLINLQNGANSLDRNLLQVTENGKIHTNHALLIIGYEIQGTDEFLILLNSWPPNLASGDPSGTLQNYITNNISFQHLLDHFKTIENPPHEIKGIQIIKETHEETIGEIIEETLKEESEGHPIKFLFLILFIVFLAMTLVYYSNKKSTTEWVELDRSYSVDSDDSPVELP